jgi:hypothetical protein
VFGADSRFGQQHGPTTLVLDTVSYTPTNRKDELNEAYTVRWEPANNCNLLLGGGHAPFDASTSRRN